MLQKVTHVPISFSNFQTNSTTWTSVTIILNTTYGITTNSTITTAKALHKLMTSYTPGRLGNKMGVHAASLGLAQINGYKPVMEKSMVEEMGKYFDLKTPEMDKHSKNKSWAVIAVKDYIIDEYRNWNYTNVQLYGYVNSWTFFHHIRPIILEEFTFKKTLQDESQRILHEISNKLQRRKTFVGIHVRRGDYVKVMPETWKGVIADMKYLEEAMNIFRKRYADSVFIVVSDDKEWCKNNFNFSLGDVFVVGNSNQSSPGQDMATLVACNHTIMTIGTFGFWASYLCGGDVIYLANYTLPDSPLLNIVRHNSSYLPEWHGINADLSPLATTHSSK